MFTHINRAQEDFLLTLWKVGREGGGRSFPHLPHTRLAQPRVPRSSLNIPLEELRIPSHHILPCQHFHRWRRWITLTTCERWTCSWQLKKKKHKPKRAQPCSTVCSGRTRKNVGVRGRRDTFFYSSHTCFLTRTCACSLSVIPPVMTKIQPLVLLPPRNRVDYWEAVRSDDTRGWGTFDRWPLFLSPSKHRFIF